MGSNLDKYRGDLQRLIKDGEMLYLAILSEYSPEQFARDLKGLESKDRKVSEFVKALPFFSDGYQVWYSEALSLVRQLLPDRLADFTRLYEKPKVKRKGVTYENYVIEDSLQRLTVTRSFLNEKVVGPDAAIPLFRQQLNILKSISRRFESSLFDIRQLVQSDLFESELDSASDLNKRGFVRAAGAVAGVVLEGHLLQVCKNHKLTIKKRNPSLNDLAQALKDADVIDIPIWRKIQHLADLRNLCDHKKSREPKSEEIDELITGVTWVTKTLF